MDKKSPRPEKFRHNKEIKVPKVRLIGSDGVQLGEVITQLALALATHEGLDLVEISPKAKPPVCKILDYGKFMYDKKKTFKKHVRQQTKEVKLSPNISDHDLFIKVDQMRKFLLSNKKVKVTVCFKGRQMAHLHIGENLLRMVNELLINEIVEEGKIPQAEGKTMSMLLEPFVHKQ